MSRNQRIGLLVAAAVVAVVAIAIAASSGSDDNEKTAQTTTTEEPSGGGATATETTPTDTTEEAPAEPAGFKVDIKGGQPVGGVQNIKVKKGDQVTIVVTADAHDDIHLHGYDIEKPVEPGKPATFEFTATIEGIFDMESHVAEDAGREPQVAKLTVEPN